jgi:hypothetical protein
LKALWKEKWPNKITHEELFYGDVAMSLVVNAGPNEVEYWPGQNQLVSSLMNYGDLILAGTFTIKRVKGYLSSQIRRDVERALKIWLRRVNNHFYKKLYNRGKKSLPFIASFETKFDGENPHIHFAIGAPEGRNYEELKSVVLEMKDKISLFHHRADIQPLTSSGWVSYITKGGSDSLLLECCNRGK